MIYAVSPDREKVETARKRIDSSGLYGGRISVEAWPLDGLPYADYFANLVVSETAVLGGQLPSAPAEMFRLLKPVGGVALLGRPAVESIAVHAAGSDTSPKRKRGSQPGPSLALRATVDHHISDGERFDEGRDGHSAAGANAGPEPDDLSGWLSQSKLEGRMVHDDGDWVKIVRGPLADSGSWTGLYGNAGNTACGDDRRVRWPLGVLWFAAPGPESTIDRHRRSVAPLSIDGRLFCQGEDLLAAYDAYNGLMLWQRRIEGAVRTERLPRLRQPGRRSPGPFRRGRRPVPETRSGHRPDTGNLRSGAGAEVGGRALGIRRPLRRLAHRHSHHRRRNVARSVCRRAAQRKTPLVLRRHADLPPFDLAGRRDGLFRRQRGRGH